MPSISRRELLRGAYALSGISALPIAGCADEVDCDPNTMRLPRPDSVVVIGAGAAGLTATRILRDAGIDVTILEARDRIGGRLHTVDLAGATVDLGGAWIHGRPGNPVASFCDDHGLRFREDPQDIDVYADAISGRASPDAVIQLEDEVDRFHSNLGRIRRNIGSSASFAEGIEWYIRDQGLTSTRARRTRFMLHLVNENDYAGPSADTSLRWYYEDEDFGSTDYRIDGGYAPFVGALADGIDVVTGSPVTAIERVSDGVTVRTADAEFSADVALVTIPLGVLKSGGPTFAPALSASKIEAIQRLDMSSLEKVILRFDERSWTDVFECVAVREAEDGLRRFPVFQDFSAHAGSPTVIAFHGGGAARDVLDTYTDDDDVIRLALQSMGEVLGRTAPTPTDALVTRWRSDPWARGSYSFIPLDGSRRHMCSLSQPEWDGRLLFAGEATDPDYYGSVHAAMRSAAREVRRFDVTIELPDL
jgi:monoamine oxidase